MNQGLVFDEKQLNTPVCDVCLHEIDESIHRIIIFQNSEKNPTVKRFHFFFPCWDMDYICQNYADHKIVKAGFSCEKNILNVDKIRRLQRNYSLWE